MSALERASEAWAKAGGIPDWVAALAAECDRTSQNRVAKMMGRSSTLISQILSMSYPAETTAVERRVRGLLMDATVDCPVLGHLAVNLCQDWRVKARQFFPGNPARTRMFRACINCPQNRKEETT